MTFTKLTLATVFFGLTIASASAAVPQTGRVFFGNDRITIERPNAVKYHSGRMEPTGLKGIYSHTGRKVTNGRTG